MKAKHFNTSMTSNTIHFSIPYDEKRTNKQLFTKLGKKKQDPYQVYIKAKKQ